MREKEAKQQAEAKRKMELMQQKADKAPPSHGATCATLHLTSVFPLGGFRRSSLSLLHQAHSP